MITAHICHYPGGTLARLSPRLWLVLSVQAELLPPVRTVTGVDCQRCGERIITYPLPDAQCVVRCDCLTVVYSSGHTAQELTRYWGGFIRTKRQIEKQLAPVTNN